MKATERQASIRRQDEQVRDQRDMRLLFAAMIAGGCASIYEIVEIGRSAWPKPMAFDWFAVLGIALTVEFLRRRFVARQAAAIARLRQRR